MTLNYLFSRRIRESSALGIIALITVMNPDLFLPQLYGELVSPSIVISRFTSILLSLAFVFLAASSISGGFEETIRVRKPIVARLLLSALFLVSAILLGTIANLRGLVVEASFHIVTDSLLIVGISLLAGRWGGFPGSITAALAGGWLIITLPWVVGNNTFIGLAPGIGAHTLWLLASAAFGVGSIFAWVYSPSRAAHTAFGFTLNS